MANKTKLELTWIGKESRPRLEPRILLEDRTKSYHAKNRVTEHDIFDNRLIFGDNLLALKALEREFEEKIKCIYIDPPFNTQQALDHYDDGLEHSLWLQLMRDRLELLWALLMPEGSIFIHIDDNELGYLIVLCDQIFGRNNRVEVITFKQGSPTGHKAINPGFVTTTNFLLVYAKNQKLWRPKRLFTGRERNDRYNQFIVNRSENFSKWIFVPLSRAFADANGVRPREAKKLIPEYDAKLDKFVLDNAESVIQLARPDYEGVGAETRALIDASKAEPGKIFHLSRAGYSDIFLIRGERILFYSDTLKRIDGELVPGEPLTNLWDDISSHNLHNEGQVAFPKGKKPEGLIKRILELATDENDWILDSFAGSGTTGAVAHKMRRRWILIEMGEQCETHILPRLRRVIGGQDPSGITKAVDWRGGGGFRYCHLAPSLLAKDKFGNWIISREYNPAMLAEAVCKLEGFTYAPSDAEYWMHGYSTERDFIYVTTQVLTQQQIEKLSEEVGPERSLLVCCSAFRTKALEQFSNLTVKKIPKMVLNRCEWGKDDYSLEIEDLPPSRDAGLQRSGKATRGKNGRGTMNLFEPAAAEEAK
jgi:adenine-specific DNA-methyltransferase